MFEWITDYRRNKTHKKDFPIERKLFLEQKVVHILDMHDGHADGVPPHS